LVVDEANDQLILLDPNLGTLSVWSKGSWVTMVSRGQWVVANVIRAITYDPAHKEVVILACCQTSGGLDAWTWSGRTMAQLPTEPGYFGGQMGGELQIRMAQDGDGHLLVIGSESSGGYSWDGTSWTNLGPGAALPEYTFDMAYDAAHRQLIAVGYAHGFHTWQWEHGRWKLMATPSSPPTWGSDGNISNLVYDPDLPGVILTDLQSA